MEHDIGLGAIAAAVEEADTVEDDAEPFTQRRQRAIALDHAWCYFEYHAAQRVQLFRFFLLTSLAVIAGYFQTYVVESQFVWSFCAAAIGFVAAEVFLRLDRRSVVLIQIAEMALRDLEGDLARVLDLPTLSIMKEAAKSLRSGQSFRSLIPFLIRSVWCGAAMAMVVSISAVAFDGRTYRAGQLFLQRGQIALGYVKALGSAEASFFDSAEHVNLDLP